jgi:hypothetical protein
VEEIERHPPTKVEIFTEEHHLEGFVATGDRRFSTWLNLEDLSAIAVRDAALGSPSDLNKPDVPLEYVLVNRDAVLAVIPRDTPVASADGVQPRRALEHVDKERHGVVVSIPPFAVRGQMHMARGADLRRAVGSFPGTFIPVTDARIVHTLNPTALWQGEVVLINTSRAQLYWPSPDDSGSQREPTGADRV